MPKALQDVMAAVRSLDRDEQERAAQVLRAWLNGSSDYDLADA